MKNIFYSIECPRCKTAEKMLKQCNIEFEVCEDKDEMKRKEIEILPMLEFEGKLLNYTEIIKLTKRYENGKYDS